MMKRLAGILTILVLAALAIVPVGAEQITRVAVLDYSRILSAFYKDSQAVRELEQLKESYQEEIRRMTREITSLEDRKLEAENAGDESTALRLDNEIFQKKEYLREYIRVKGAQLSDMSNRLNQNLTLVNEILEEIQYVAESEGYSIVLKKSDPSLLWWNYEVDITEQVLQRLMSRAQSR